MKIKGGVKQEEDSRLYAPLVFPCFTIVRTTIKRDRKKRRARTHFRSVLRVLSFSGRTAVHESRQAACLSIVVRSPSERGRTVSRFDGPSKSRSPMYNGFDVPAGKPSSSSDNGLTGHDIRVVCIPCTRHGVTHETAGLKECSPLRCPRWHKVAAVERKEGQTASRPNDLTARRRERNSFSGVRACMTHARCPVWIPRGPARPWGFVGLGADSRSVTVVTESDVREPFFILILQLNLLLNSCPFHLQIRNINMTYDKFVNEWIM